MGGSRKPGALDQSPAVRHLKYGTMIRGLPSPPGPTGASVGWRDFDIIGNTLEGLAKLNFSVPLCKTLIDHYCHGDGVEFGLTTAGMEQCNALIDFGNSEASHQFLHHVKQMGEEIAKNSGGDPARLARDFIETSLGFEMLGICNTSGTLGGFTVNATGKLKVWNPRQDGTDADWSFDGHMWWFDRWDFDERPASAAGEPGRTEKGSSRTSAGSYLVGRPFDIRSAAVPVRQVRAEAKGTSHYAKWSGNPQGNLLPIRSGVL